MQRSSSADQGRPDWATIPNLVTLLRFLLLIPACLVIINDAANNIWAPILLGVWAATDWVDGALARLLDQRSRTGEVLDPIADRIGIGFVVASLAIQGALSWWVVVIILGVDLVTVIFAGRAAANGAIHVTWLGKIRTAVLLVAIVGLVLAISVWEWIYWPSTVLLWIGVALHIAVAPTYIRAARTGKGRAIQGARYPTRSRVD